MIGLVYYLWLGIALFGLGLYVALSQQNVIKILIGIELMLNASVLNFVIFSKGAHGQVMALFVMALAVAETVLALAIMLKMKKKNDSALNESL